MDSKQEKSSKTPFRFYLIMLTFILLNPTKFNKTESKLQPKNKISETIIIPSHEDTDLETRKLYRDALKQFGVFGETVDEICSPWKVKGCTCAGTSEKIELICKSTYLNSVPNELPENLIKL